MAEIPEDTERDALIDSLLEETRMYIYTCFKALSNNPNPAIREDIRLFEECLKERIVELFQLAIERARRE